jgi:hypothetical protein
MNTNTHISLNDTDLQGILSWLKTVLFLIAPKHLRLIAGHAAGKTADIVPSGHEKKYYLICQKLSRISF